MQVVLTAIGTGYAGLWRQKDPCLAQVFASRANEVPAVSAPGNKVTNYASRQEHGLTNVIKPYRARGYDRRKKIDRRYREGRQAEKFKADLISDAGGIESMTALKKAAAEILTAKFHRLLRAYGWLYRQPQPPLINSRKKALYPIVRDIDLLEDSFFRSAKESGFERVVRQLSLAELLVQGEDEGDGRNRKANDAYPLKSTISTIRTQERQE